MKSQSVSSSSCTTVTPAMLDELNRLRAENARLAAKVGEKGPSAPKPLNLELHKSGGVIVRGGPLSWKGAFFHKEQLDYVLGNADKIKAFFSANEAKIAALKASNVATPAPTGEKVACV